jgi:hypothetical protein
MAGKPTEVEIVEEDDKDFGKIRARIIEWEPESQDFVSSEAIDGSKAMSIVNSKQVVVDSDESSVQGGFDLKTMTEILAALKEHESIALSDLLTIPAIKTAIEAHVQIKLNEHEQGLPKNKEFMVKAIKSCDDDIINGSDRVGKIVNSLVEGRSRNIDALAEKVSVLARNAGINLSQPQVVLIKNNLTGEETDTLLLEIIKNASKFTKGLGGVEGIFEKPTTEKIEMSKINREGLGAGISEVDLDKVAADIAVGCEL